VTKQTDFYLNNPLVNKNRRRNGEESQWVQQFSCEDMRPLIICRGPIRKEVMDVWEEMGMTYYGILLSEKDSITYSNALAPELRQLTDPNRVHRVPDYTGADKEERTQRIQQIISIAKDNGYNCVFAGYGFMAEEEELVRSFEEAGLTFVGPCSQTVRSAGAKDEAKRTALECGVSVTPGVDNLTAITLVKKVKDLAGLKAVVKDNDLNVDASAFEAEKLEDVADDVLFASYRKGLDLLSVEEISAELKLQVAATFKRFPENRIRLKAIGGGGGKGQRILKAPTSYDGELDARITEASLKAPELFIEILNEVKTNGVGDNKNILVELNIETTRHQEIQVIGNGEWCTTLGARDCSLQMHEQKLLEVSQTREALAASIASAETAGRKEEAKALKTDLDILVKMEDESERFGLAVGLDSVSTFECIVDKEMHFFMEMNTRIQVEHRVSELCYSLKFTNPEDENDYFIVDSLVEVMTLIAKFKKALPKPERIPREHASVEARLNATNRALKPHAGGVINFWSAPREGEIRDDQGISLRNPDSGRFIKYHLAGAYDSNIALLLTAGDGRRDSYIRLSEVLRRTKLTGENLATNLAFHYGLVHWFLAENVNAKSTTGFIMPYLTMVGLLKKEANEFDAAYAFKQLAASYRKQVAAAHGDDDTSAEALKGIDNAMARKTSLLLRPMENLLAEPHNLSGWLSLNKTNVRFKGDNVEWLKNPIEVLNETYHFLNMDYREDLPAAESIWKHDNDVLQSALSFYETVKEALGTNDYPKLAALLDNTSPQGGYDADTWAQVQAAHLGYQSGLEIFSVLPKMAQNALYYELKVNADLTITIPARLTDGDLQADMIKVLVPPPATKADELVAVCGGMFYAREAPGMPAFVEEGAHVEAGDPIYIIEVMKMFNKIYAPFACTIDKVLMENMDGAIIKEGAPLFKVTPDEIVIEEDPVVVAKRRKARTEELLLGLV